MSLVLQNLELLADSSAIALEDGKQKITYAQLSEYIANAEKLLEIYSGLCVALALDNSIEWVLLDLASIRQKVTLLPIPSFFTPEQTAHALKDAGAALIITDKEPELLQTKIVKTKLLDRQLYIYRTSEFRTKLPQGTAKITYTSGTTGTPKGVCLSQDGMERVATSLLKVIGQDAAKRHMAVLPLPILLENIAGLYTTLLAGGTYVVKPQRDIGFAQSFKPNFELLIKELKTERITSCILVPELLKGLLFYLSMSGHILPDMRFMAVGGSKVSPQLLDQALTAKLPVFQGYGLSESASVVAVNTPAANMFESVGKPLPHIDLNFAEDGEIVITNPAILGYTNSEFSAKEYKTGDIGYLDKEGFLHITGRKKNILINSYGRNISPEWPESELTSLPQIAQAFVYGDGEATLSALIVPASDKISKDQISILVGSVNKGLPSYARIESWQLAMPFTLANGMLTATGRLRRAEILKHYQLANTLEKAI